MRSHTDQNRDSHGPAELLGIPASELARPEYPGLRPMGPGCSNADTVALWQTVVPSGQHESFPVVRATKITGLLPKTLLASSGAALLVGLYVPAAIVLDSSPSIMVYGLVLFSFPLWLIGCVCAAVAGWLLRRGKANRTAFDRIPWLLTALNLLSILLCLVWQPAGIS